MAPRWWRRVLWLAGFACLWLNVCDDPPLRSGAMLRDVTATSATVGIIAPSKAEAALLVRGEDGAVVAEVRGAPRRRHTLRVDGLSEGWEYRYEVSLDGKVADQGRIRTPRTGDQAPVRFAFLGDSGGQPWWVWLQRTPILHWPARLGWFGDRREPTAIGRAVAAFEPDFVLHLGDVIYPRGLHAHYFSGCLRPFGAAMRNAPMFVALGNHDVMDAGGQQALANLGGLRGDVTGDARCVTFARGPVRVVLWDFNAFAPGDPAVATSPVLAALQRVLDEVTEPWIVVATHYPIRSASRQRNRGELLAHILPVLERAGVSLYLSGHDHCYQRFGRPELGEVPLVVSGGGGKDLYEVRPDRHAAVLASQFHWCSAEVVGASLKIRSHGLDGAELDAFEVPAPSGEVLAGIAARNAERATRIERLRR